MFTSLSLVIASASPLYAFQNSDGVGKGIVLLLFLGSILTWFIMLEKGIALLRAKRASEEFITIFRDKKYPLSVLKTAFESFSPVARVYESGAEKLTAFYGLSDEEAMHYGSSRCPKQSLTPAEIEAFRTVMEREVSDQIFLLEDKIGLLATAVSVSPFFGLFGTVWGVMMAFCGVAIAGKPDISALAPGVSGALLTTVVGLLVAIPSLIGYNLLTIMIRKITVHMDNFVEEFVAKINLEQLDVE